MLQGDLSGRLVTQNLLATAGVHETKEDLSWDSIHDLCVLIDVYCLYDRLTVLGRQAYSLLPQQDSDFFDVLRHAVHVLDFDEGAKITGAAAGHLTAFLGDKAGEDRFQPAVIIAEAVLLKGISELFGELPPQVSFRSNDVLEHLRVA